MPRCPLLSRLVPPYRACVAVACGKMREGKMLFIHVQPGLVLQLRVVVAVAEGGGGMVLTGGVVSELQDGSAGRTRGEGGGRPARAAHRVKVGAGYTKKASARAGGRASGEESGLQGRRPGRTRVGSRNKHIIDKILDKGINSPPEQRWRVDKKNGSGTHPLLFSQIFRDITARTAEEEQLPTAGESRISRAGRSREASGSNSESRNSGRIQDNGRSRVNNGNTRKPQNLTETKAGKIGLLGGGIGSAWHEMRRLRTKMKSNCGQGSNRYNTASPRHGIESFDIVAVADIKI
ncbi:hypothetical protein DFH08DRAFT_811253 [Mycena albidolilacea]|uniref:Uncharacterized protein n=1 Tax=Mycena albidolilacea TaxID=1033008 RepID=A0AAD6ZWE3_9AGAR|nr:hypothetical protein DFH08DRAFT_811253 [Mycena albidolilacea]